MSSLDIFSPFKLGPLQLPNRVVMAPMTRNRAGRGSVPGPLNATYYAQRASAGLMISEATQISPQGVGYPGTPASLTPCTRPTGGCFCNFGMLAASRIRHCSLTARFRWPRRRLLPQARR